MLEYYRDIWTLLGAKSRREGVRLVALALVAGLFEVVGVASILPFLAVVADADAALQQPLLRAVYDTLGFDETIRFLLFLGVAVFVLSVLGQGLKALTVFTAIKFSTRQQHLIGARLFKSHLSRSYDWFLHQHSSDLAKLILSETDLFVQQVLLPSLRVISSGAVLVSVVVLLLVISPGVALSAGVGLGVAYGVFYRSVRRKLSRLGDERIVANSARYKSVQEAFGGIKEVKSNGLEDVFLGQFANHARTVADRYASALLLHMIPRYFLETLIVATMLALVLVLLLSGDGSINTALPVLGLFAFATARIFPALQEVYASLAMMRTGRPICLTLSEHLRGGEDCAPDDDGTPIRLRHALSFEGVQYLYPNATDVAVDVSLVIPAGTSLGVVGMTGAGKTTMVDLLLGLLSPSKGTVRIDDVDLTTKNAGSWRRHIGYVPQQAFLADDTLAANVAFGELPERIDRVAVQRACKIAELDQFIEGELPDAYETMIGERGVRLSGGQRQRIGIARALYRDPDVLIFDEATSALDNITERRIMDAIRQLGPEKTIIHIAHRLTTIRECDAIILMSEGRILGQGTYDELYESSPDFRALVEAAEDTPRPARGEGRVSFGAVGSPL